MNRIEKDLTRSGSTNAADLKKTQAIQENRLERRWFWIAFLFFLLLSYMQSSGTSALFASTIDEVAGEGVSERYGSIVIAITIFFAPISLKRYGILDNTDKMRKIIAGSAFIAAVSIILYTVYYALLINPDQIWVGMILQFFIVAIPAMIAGCVMYRVVMVMDIKSAAYFSGLILVCTYILLMVDMAFYASVVNNNVVWAMFLSYYPIVYIILLSIPVIMLVTTKEDTYDTSHRITVLFSDSLFFKFMLLAAMLFLLDTCAQHHRYAGAVTAEYGTLFNMIVAIFPIPSLLLITWLLKKGKWMPTIVACTILYCFMQGISIFIYDEKVLGYAYVIGGMIFGAGNSVFVLYIPLVFCLQRRSGAGIITGIVALSLVSDTIIKMIASVLYPDIPPNAIVMPAISFVLSLVTIAYLFYLYNENSRIHIAAMVDDFQLSNAEQVTETVSKADLLQGLGLTPREKEVCALLLKTYTIRQISGELGLSFATVNGYYRSLYRKLGINSKAELFMRFGAEPAKLSNS